jgi:hypothetical protein
VPALLFPIFKRERTDKTAARADIGLEQLTARTGELTEGGGSARTTAKSEVVKRAVYTKEMKGQTAVRKYVVVETRKREAGYPPFVVHFTDFSAGRAKPLETSMRSASSREKVDGLVAAWVEENVKKGWSEAGVAASTNAPAAPPVARESDAETPKPKKRASKKTATEG